MFSRPRALLVLTAAAVVAPLSSVGASAAPDDASRARSTSFITSPLKSPEGSSYLLTGKMRFPAPKKFAFKARLRDHCPGDGRGALGAFRIHFKDGSTVQKWKRVHRGGCEATMNWPTKNWRKATKFPKRITGVTAIACYAVKGTERAEKCETTFVVSPY